MRRDYIPDTARKAEQLCVEYGFDSVQAMQDDIPLRRIDP
jgi:hypothetical protein